MKALLYIICVLLLASCQQGNVIEDHLHLKAKLSGQWTANAFDGELHESWRLNSAGWMEQQGYYIEAQDTSYAAKTQIQKVGDDIILFSVIENGNPKIFKAMTHEENKIIFENDDYKNPSQVTYEFLSADQYRRTIRGYENDSLVTYQFNFNKVN